MKKRRDSNSLTAPATTPLPDGEAIGGARGASARPARGAQPGNANARQHGVYSLQRRLKSAGLAKLDGRSALERLKRDWKDDVRTALGGDLSPQKEALLELAANTWLMASSADDWIVTHGPINRRRGALRPIVEQRAKLVRTLRELLAALGLDRVPVEPGETLRDVVARYQRDEDGDPMGTPRLDARGRSVARKNRRHPGNEFPPGEPESPVSPESPDAWDGEPGHPAPFEVGASSSRTSCSSSAAPVLSFSDDELSEGSSSLPASSSSDNREDPGRGTEERHDARDHGEGVDAMDETAGALPGGDDAPGTDEEDPR